MTVATAFPGGGRWMDGDRYSRRRAPGSRPTQGKVSAKHLRLGVLSMYLPHKTNCVARNASVIHFVSGHRGYKVFLKIGGGWGRGALGGGPGGKLLGGIRGLGILSMYLPGKMNCVAHRESQRYSFCCAKYTIA